MSSGRSTKTHVIAWIVAVFVGVPVLYLLSVPPVCLTNGAYPPTRNPLYNSAQVLGYGKMYAWISMGDSPMSEPFLAYWNWWEDILGHPPPRR